MILKRHIFSMAMLFATQAHAIDFMATNTYKVAQDQVISGEQWVAANTVDTAGTFKNDLFIMSGTDLVLNGIHEGNVWGISSTLTEAGGSFNRNIRLLGRAIKVRGDIAQNLMALCDTIVLPADASVGGDLKLIGNSMVLEGHVGGDADITSARLVTVGGTIDGDVKIIAPDILFSRDAKIGGNLTYTANKEIVPPEGIVSGTIQRISPQAPPVLSRARFVSRGLWFVAALMAGIPFITLFPMTSAMASQIARTSPWKSLLVGMLASGALPIFGLVCISSLIGVPLGALILATWGIMLYLSRIVMGLVIGMLILRPTTYPAAGRVVLAMALGLATIYTASFLPAIGVPVQLAVVWIGTGALMLALLQKRRLIIQVPHELKHLEELKKNQSNPKEE
jgi:cytoskeletal protein CcmA (bactofilin family)